MPKFYNSWDRSFVCDTFDSSFTGLNGKVYAGPIGGASVFVAVIPVDRHTGQPSYNECKSEDEYPEANLDFNQMFRATIDAELGVLIIPDAHNIELASTPGITYAFRIESYTIDIGSGFLDPILVSEAEFRRFIKENFAYFNNPDNYFAQSMSYGCHHVNTEYPRMAFYVGYDSCNCPTYVPSGPREKELKMIYSSATTEAQARKYASLLVFVTPSEAFGHSVDSLIKLASERGWKESDING